MRFRLGFVTASLLVILLAPSAAADTLVCSIGPGCVWHHVANMGTCGDDATSSWEAEWLYASTNTVGYYTSATAEQSCWSGHDASRSWHGTSWALEASVQGPNVPSVSAQVSWTNLTDNHGSTCGTYVFLTTPAGFQWHDFGCPAGNPPAYHRWPLLP